MMPVKRPSNIVFIAVGATLILAFFALRIRHASNSLILPFSSGSTGATANINLIDDVHNNSLGFEKIFVIGLPSRTDRRDSMVLASALSNIEIEYVNGVIGSTVPDKALPKVSTAQQRPADPMIGSWRGHINAIQEIVRRNLSSALIMEDDADWDIRIREQLHDFALSSQALTQPLQGPKAKYADPSYPRHPSTPSKLSEISFGNLPRIETPKVSPYGDNWDVLWLGHCGMHFPTGNLDIPGGLVVHENDLTVPQHQHLWTLSDPNDIKEHYPEHTRAIHHVEDGICSLVYAVSQKGARQLLSEAGLKNFDAAFDIILRWFCEGTGGRRYHVCLTSSPGLFQHYRPVGPKSSNSDISDHGDGFQETAHTEVLRWSVRLNADAIMAGEPIIDQYPDE